MAHDNLSSGMLATGLTARQSLENVAHDLMAISLGEREVITAGKAAVRRCHLN